MNTIEHFRNFVRAYPRYRFQPGALAAFQEALRDVSPDDLLVSVRLFASEVRASHPNGRAWRYCVGPTRWLQEQHYKAYLPEEHQ